MLEIDMRCLVDGHAGPRFRGNPKGVTKVKPKTLSLKQGPCDRGIPFAGLPFDGNGQNQT